MVRFGPFRAPASPRPIWAVFGPPETEPSARPETGPKFHDSANDSDDDDDDDDDDDEDDDDDDDDHHDDDDDDDDDDE